MFDWSLRRKKNRRKVIFEGIMVDNFPKLMKDMNLQIQRAQQIQIG